MQRSDSHKRFWWDLRVKNQALQNGSEVILGDGFSQKAQERGVLEQNSGKVREWQKF